MTTSAEEGLQFPDENSTLFVDATRQVLNKLFNRLLEEENLPNDEIIKIGESILQRNPLGIVSNKEIIERIKKFVQDYDEYLIFIDITYSADYLIDEIHFKCEELKKNPQTIEGKEEEEEEHKERNQIKDLTVLFKEGIPPIKWKVKNIVREGGITIFGGTSGTFKTFTAMDLALCCLSGKKFLGQFETKKSRILYIDEENGDIVTYNRLKELVKGYEYDLEEGFALSVFNQFRLDNEAVIVRLKMRIQEFKPDIIIFDSIVRCLDGEEDKSKDVRLIFDHLKEIMDMFPEISYILLHHTAKGQTGLNSLRGSGDFAAFADVVMMFTKLQDGSVKSIFEKNRHIDTQKLQNFNFKPISNENEDCEESEKFFKFEFLGYNTESVTKKMSCLKALLIFLKNKGNMGCLQIEAVKFLEKSLGFTERMSYKVINESIFAHSIKREGKNLFFQDEYQSEIEEESVE